MSVVVVSAPWPDVVWDAPMLRNLDARSRGEIEASGRLRHLRAGELLYKPGDPADALYVVASGVCTLSRVRRGEAVPSVIRRATKSEVFGEEATVATFSTRQLEARCEADAVVAEVPLVVLKRAVGRAGGVELIAKVERVLRRAATRDLLRTTSFTSGLSDADAELMLDAARHVQIARGEHVYREGDVAAEAFVVADGLLQVQTDDDGKPRVEAYLNGGDLFGDEELEERKPRACAVVGSGPTWLVAIPRDVFVTIARRNREGLAAARRLRSEGVAAEKRTLPGAQTTAHVFRDLYRMRVARSLLVIDQDSCIRCGHCAWSCADAHEDGVSRLVRRGDKIVVSDGEATPERPTTATAPLLVPNSCQHCKNPSCMIDCPTGAIGRDARGEVFIREDLCTGCGNCAKGCPWENIQMAPRAESTTKAHAAVQTQQSYPLVAVKCDLCKGLDGGPACVAACPTQAIARIDPSMALVELRVPTRDARGNTVPESPRPVMPPRVVSWPWVLGAALSGSGFAMLSLDRWLTGLLIGALVFFLVAYSVAKRLRGLPFRRGKNGALARLRGRVPLARWLYISHMSVGVLTCGVVAAHVDHRVPATAAGALTIAVALAALSGCLGALIGAVVPPALARIERKSVLPEELAARPKEIDERIFSALSGKSELVKTLFSAALGPYRRAWYGPFVLLASRRSLRREEKVLRARLDVLTVRPDGDGRRRRSAGDASATGARSLMGAGAGPGAGAEPRTGAEPGAGPGAGAGLDDLVQLVVEHRAVRAQRILTWTLRGWLVPHLAATVAAIVLLGLHVFAVSRPIGLTRPDKTPVVASARPR